MSQDKANMFEVISEHKKTSTDGDNVNYRSAVALKAYAFFGIKKGYLIKAPASLIDLWVEEKRVTMDEAKIGDAITNHLPVLDFTLDGGFKETFHIVVEVPTVNISQIENADEPVHAVALKDMNNVGVKIGNVVKASQSQIVEWERAGAVDPHEMALKFASDENAELVDLTK